MRETKRIVIGLSITLICLSMPSTTFAGKTKLHEAIENRTGIKLLKEKNNYELFSKILDENIKNINTKDENGYTPLHLAIVCATKFNDIDNPYNPIIKLLLKNGAKTENIVGKKTPLHTALDGNLPSIAENLLLYGGDVQKIINKQDTQGNTPMHCLVCIKSIRDPKGMPNITEPENCLQNISSASCERVFNLLIKNKANVKTKNKFKQTPCLVATACGNFDLAEKLLNLGNKLQKFESTQSTRNFKVNKESFNTPLTLEDKKKRKSLSDSNVEIIIPREQDEKK